LKPRGARATLLAVEEPVIYREEVRAIMEALSDMVVYLRQIKETLRGEEEEEDG
jgi:hypothetical protein